MWRHIHASAAGTAHLKNQTDCQDTCGCNNALIAGKPGIVAAVADGAGCALHSRVGSSLAVGHVLATIPEITGDWLANPAPIAMDIYQRAIDYINAIAAENQRDPAEMASTLLVAIVNEDGGVFIQLGDGGWVAGQGAAAHAPTWPDRGEYANETVFLTSANWAQHIQIATVLGKISYVAGFTDGLQNLLLDLASHTPHMGFFTPFVSALTVNTDSDSLQAQLTSFLSSERVNSRTDDDKSLVCAWTT